MKLGMFKLIGIFVERPHCGSCDWSPSHLSHMVLLLHICDFGDTQKSGGSSLAHRAQRNIPWGEQGLRSRRSIIRIRVRRDRAATLWNSAIIGVLMRYGLYCLVSCKPLSLRDGVVRSQAIRSGYNGATPHL